MIKTKKYCQDFKNKGGFCKVIGKGVPKGFCQDYCKYYKNGKNIQKRPKIKIEPPTLSQMLKNFALAMKQFALSGFEIVSVEEYIRRIKICSACNGGIRCPYCGCNMPLKVAMKTMNCYKNYWYPQRVCRPSKNVFFDKDKQPLRFDKTYSGKDCFLWCGGPRLMCFDLAAIKETGIEIMAIQNAGLYQPTLWTIHDSCEKFDSSIWENPHIQKFFSAGKIRKFYSSKKIRIGELENTVFFEVDTKSIDISNWLSSYKIQLAVQGEENIFLCTMLQAINILWLLGFRNVYILGADFEMKQEVPYAYDFPVDERHVQINNERYLYINRYLSLLNVQFKANDFNVYNCDEQSKCTAFEYKSFDIVMKGINNGK